MRAIGATVKRFGLTTVACAVVLVAAGAAFAAATGDARPFAVERVASVEVAAGDGEAHAYVLYFDAGGLIGQHEAGISLR